VLTDSSHVCGTDRCAEAALKLGKIYSIVVNVQGDEPMVEPDHVDATVSHLLNSTDPNVVVGTLVSQLIGEKEVLNVNRVKVVLDTQNHILYFSRGLIPHNKKGQWDPQVTYYRHIGLFAFRHDFLQKFQSLATSTLQQIEDVELIKVLEYGYRIKASIVGDAHPGVDTPQDLITLNEYLSSNQKH
jgi:3-deoxy-manno-octulosonate cytidylyltransferase (CMP-KDO synthetase)